MQIPEFNEIIEPNDQTEARSEHLTKLRELIGNAYPNKFERSTLSGGEDTITAILASVLVAEIAKEMSDVRAALKEGERPPAEVKDALNERLKALGNVAIAGRVMTPLRGNFVHLTDGRNKLQIYAKKGQFALVKNDAERTADEENAWTAWQLIDHGDFIGVEGYLFITNTGEVSVHVERLQFLSKAMLPMPDKMHGIADAEIRQRQRYYDLIGSSLAVDPDRSGLTTREVFERRAKLVSSLRNFLEDHGYIEVETPMLTPKATGAAATPFETHHNALDITLYARIAPELYLKRLLVGGFEKVYELNRNFRNEGISFKHNPEFTMLEFYCAYMDVNGMMDFCERLLRESIQKATGDLTIDYEGSEIDFTAFRRLTMNDAILDNLPDYFPKGQIDILSLEDASKVDQIFWFYKEVEKETDKIYRESVKAWDEENEGNITSGPRPTRDVFQTYSLPKDFFDNFWRKSERRRGSLLGNDDEIKTNAGQQIEEMFSAFVEPKLLQPTFIINYPKSISPLSKADPANPAVAERFELFVNGMEVANGFSELNDPREQYDRFVDQMSERERGDEEAMVLDEDYIRALSYGMPPAAGIGIGVDRLTMLITNKHSIRDVILFPHMRPEKRDGEKGNGAEEEKGT